MLILLTIRKPRPYFAEVPYYLWGEVNYDSDGDCRRPTDQQWTWLDLASRITVERVKISSSAANFEVAAEIPELAGRTARFLIARCGAAGDLKEVQRLSGAWSHDEAMARTQRIRAEFPRPELKPFDSHHFWGSWK